MVVGMEYGCMCGCRFNPWSGIMLDAVMVLCLCGSEVLRCMRIPNSERHLTTRCCI